jgi:predicted Na+-dependent transporter
MLRALLSFAGRHGPLMLFTGVFVGLLAPNLAASARPLMGAAVFVLTLGAFLKVDKDALRLDLARPGRLLWLPLWIALGVPLLTWALLSVLPLPDGTKVGMLLCMLAPPVGSAAAIAAMLGLNPAMALSATLVVSLLCPFILPPAALALGAIALHMDAGALMLRLALLVGGAATVAAALRRWAGGWVDSNPHAMTGVSVLGLIVGAMGAMHGMQAQWLQHGQDMALNLVLAFALNAGFQWLGTVLFAPLGRTDALTAGLLSGNRNVSLVWVAAMPWLAGLPGAELYFAASVFPIFMLPLPLARLLAWQQQRNSSLHRFDRQRCEMPVAPVADCPQTAYAAPTTGTQRKP